MTYNHKASEATIEIVSQHNNINSSTTADIAFAMLVDSQNTTSPHHPETALAVFMANRHEASTEQLQQSRDIVQHFIDSYPDQRTVATATKAAEALDRQAMIDIEITLNALGAAATTRSNNMAKSKQTHSFAAGYNAGSATITEAKPHLPCAGQVRPFLPPLSVAP